MVESYQVYQKEVRDPLYGYIYLTVLEAKLVDTWVFQRLGRLLQNPGTSLVYPNATHTRKAHSLGVMHLAGIALKKLLARQCKKDGDLRFQTLLTESVVSHMNKKGELEEEKNLLDLTNTGVDWWDNKIERDPSFVIEVLRVAALMHDVGHGPFSHIFEQAVKTIIEDYKDYTHEKTSVTVLRNIIDNEGEYLAKNVPRLTSKEKEIITRAAEVLEGKLDVKLPFLKEIIDGPIDVDKLDYVNRDAYHSGVLEYGLIDYERVLDGLRVVKSDNKGKLVFSKSSIGAISRTLKALEYMYSHVYYHKTSRAVDIQLLEMLTESKTVMNGLLKNNMFLQVSDDVMIYKILKEESSKRAKRLAEKYLRRELEYKMVDEIKVGLGVLLKLAQQTIEGVKKKLEDEFSKYWAKFDYYAVSPVRLDPKRIVEWLDHGIILDKDGSLKTLRDIEPTLSKEIENFGVVIRIYIEREKATDPQLVNQVRQRFRVEVESEIGQYLR
jgi:HD superfamily phosphohydrolase